MIKKINNKYITAENIIFGVFLFISTCILIKKCKYSFAYADESFFLATPYRLYQGDALLIDEWNVTQLSSFLMIPIFNLVMKIQGLTGIILTFRYIFVCVQALVSMVLFNMLKKYSKFGAIVGVIAFLWYTPYSINALSYNSMGIISLALFTAFWVSEGKVRMYSVCAGIFLAFSVLCNPFLVILHVGIVLGTMGYCVFSKEKANLLLSKVLWLTFGIAIVGIVFCIYIYYHNLHKITN